MALPPLYSQVCHASSLTSWPRLAALSVVTSMLDSRAPCCGPIVIQQWSSDTFTMHEGSEMVHAPALVGQLSQGTGAGMCRSHVAACACCAWHMGC